MYNDLHDFEQGLKKKYSCETEFVHSPDIQNVVDYCHFNLVEIIKIIKGGIMLGPKAGFLSDAFCFHSNIGTAEMLVEKSLNKIRFIYCEDTRYIPVIYVVAFPKQHEAKYARYFRKIEKLKAFL